MSSNCIKFVKRVLPTMLAIYIFSDTMRSSSVCTDILPIVSAPTTRPRLKLPRMSRKNIEAKQTKFYFLQIFNLKLLILLFRILFIRYCYYNLENSLLFVII